VQVVGQLNSTEVAGTVRPRWLSVLTRRQLHQLPIAALAALIAPLVTAAASPSPSAAPTIAEVEVSAPPSAWRPVAPENLLLVDTARGTLTIELAPGFAPAHVAAIRALVRAHAFTGGAVVRVQDNYVVQFAAKAAVATAAAPGIAATAPALPAEYERPRDDVPFTPLPYPDAYAPQAGFSDGWPVARDAGAVWLVHCYAMVGVGRDLPPSTGDGSELYAVIGHAPRHLDRNLAVVGRVIAGIAPFAALPRGTEALGFYKTEPEKLPITSARIAADLPVAQRPNFEVMRSDTPVFSSLITARANRREPFFLRPAGGVDVCNVRIPTRPVSVR
jgi:peptidylprolyl isomerase